VEIVNETALETAVSALTEQTKVQRHKPPRAARIAVTARAGIGTYLRSSKKPSPWLEELVAYMDRQTGSHPSFVYFARVSFTLVVVESTTCTSS